MIWVPLAKVAGKDIEDFLRELIKVGVLVNTMEYPFYGRNVKITWKIFPLKCVHHDCGR